MGSQSRAATRRVDTKIKDGESCRRSQEKSQH